MGFAPLSPSRAVAPPRAQLARPRPRGGTDRQRRHAGTTSPPGTAPPSWPGREPSAERAPPGRARGPTARASPGSASRIPRRPRRVRRKGCGGLRRRPGPSRGRDEVEPGFRGGSSHPHRSLEFEPEKHPRSSLRAPLLSTTALPALRNRLKDGSGREDCSVRGNEEFRIILRNGLPYGE